MTNKPSRRGRPPAPLQLDIRLHGGQTPLDRLLLQYLEVQEEPHVP